MGVCYYIAEGDRPEIIGLSCFILLYNLQTPMAFPDYFSKQAREYARYRPRYPSELFAYLASISPRRQLAWDCGTGNGQAARELVKHFSRVVATDASAEQLAQAAAHERIDYRVERAEEVGLESHSVDLVTVAIAVHWFDLEQFYRSVRRVVVTNGVLAVWTYHLPAIEPGVDRVLEQYYRDVLAGYWQEQMHYVDERYRTLPFPFDPLQPPEFPMVTNWDLAQVVGFLESWSATRRYQQERGQHPLSFIWPDLAETWGEPDRRRRIRWPLYLKVGRV
jgi:SAM-dependent methyltransferase